MRVRALRARAAGRRRPLRSLSTALLLAVTLTLGVTSAGAGTAEGTRAAAVNSTLNWAIQTNPPSLFNAYYFGTEGSMMFSLTTQHILEPGVFGQPTTGPGAVVQRWRAVTPTKYVYTIKKGIRFSDGSRLTAKDVAFSLNIHRDKKTGSRMFSFFNNVRSVGAKGDNVTVLLFKPDSKWQFVPGSSAGFVYSKADHARKGAAFGTPSGLPVGTGPYRWAQYQPNSKVVLERNPYWKGKRYPWNQIVFSLIPDANARLLAMQSGQIDGTFAVPSNDIPLWIKAPNMKVGTYNSGGWRGFSLDTEDGPFRDVNVRRALAYALDKSSINEALTSSRGAVLDGLPPLIFLRALLPKAEIEAALKKVPKYPFSVEKAKAELAKSAYPRGFSTTLNVPNGCAACLLLSQVLQQGADKIGVNIRLNMMPGPQRFQVILDHKPNLGIQVLGQGPDTPHPMDKPDLLYHSSKAAPGFENSANYKNAQVDRWIEEGLRSSDLKVAARNALKIMQAVARDVPYIPIFSIPGGWAVKPNWKFKSSLGPFHYNQIWLDHLIAR